MSYDSDKLRYPVKRQINDRLYELQEPFTVSVGGHVTIALPGFCYDGFSVPRSLWWFQSPFTGPGTVAALDHDAKYAKMWEGGRRLADKIFYDLLRQYGVSRSKALIMYRAVRDFGWLCWDKSDAEIEQAKKFVQIYPEAEGVKIATAIARGWVMADLLKQARAAVDIETEQRIRLEMVKAAAGDHDNLIE